MMNPSRWKGWAPFAAFSTFVLAAVWFVPPALQSLMHACPARPDGSPMAGAVPAFARKYGVACTQCHSNWPTLNDFGRQFKLNGYVMEGQEKTGVLDVHDLWTEKNFPLSAIIRSRPFDMTAYQHGFNMQGFNDADLFIAGGDAAHHVSIFGEIDVNSSGGFTPAGGDYQAGYHPSQYINVVGARRGFLVMDPYQTYSNFGSPTLAPRATALLQPDQSSISGQSLDETVQTVYGYGTADKEGVGQLYYAGGITTGNGQDNGAGPKNGNMRLVFDTLKGFWVGGFGTWGSATPAGSGTNVVDFHRVGADVLVEKGPVTARGAATWTHDQDDIAGLKENNKAAYVELQYVFKRAGSNIPFLVPLFRENYFTTGDNAFKFNYITFQLAHYFESNFKGFFEYTADTKQDFQMALAAVARKDQRFTLQAEYGF
jgi:hypothetical protein